MITLAIILSAIAIFQTLVLTIKVYKKDPKDDAKVDIVGNQITFRDEKGEVFLIIIVQKDTISMINKERRLFMNKSLEKDK